ncbi:hypothetical protein EDC30_10326 [Paucimonas lemoignei]|uniref:Uncharacterized protein n=1 Tax=Paucimonas lemoignei TaxID=29443 RepID=A0A4R3HY01_PAULE|nr:hypothetical protein [Paucimonas lemoignei]TCS37734.1 hypothetical protein EDC30_10326 [Paucimonas lemoignei]
MTSINRFDRALETLRQALAERPGKNAAAGKSSQGREVGRAAASNRTQQLRRRIKDRLASLDLSQRAGQEKGATIFLETVLGNEFGAELLEDPAFYNLLADVRNTMFADQGTQKDLVSLLMELKGSN